MKTCCKDCISRTMTCHNDCLKYKAFCKEREEIRRKRDLERDIETIICRKRPRKRKRYN